MFKLSDVPVGAGLVAFSTLIFFLIVLGLVGVRIDWSGDKPVGFNLPWKRHISVNGQLVLSGHKLFMTAECGKVSDPCKIEFKSRAFSSEPNCFLQTFAVDASGYQETLVIKSITQESLHFWKGNRLNNGTTMRVDWMCVGK